jgi:SAM-dependent methyltransferase
MHVVDLGSGAGDMAMLAARLVGPTGSVLGIERNPESVALAGRRIAEAGLANVSFVEADVADLATILRDRKTPVDAVVGRLILMWMPARLDVLKACAACLAPGALVWAFDVDIPSDDWTVPPLPLWGSVRSWILEMVAGVGAEMRMGLRLHEFFRAAGLPAPQLRRWTGMYNSAQAPVWFAANIVRGGVPFLERLGLATAAEIDIDTLESRLTRELELADGIMVLPPFTAAWARVPSA